MNLDSKLFFPHESEQLRSVMVEFGGGGDVVHQCRAAEFDVFGGESSGFGGLVRVKRWDG
jgi:hypothetical protein